MGPTREYTLENLRGREKVSLHTEPQEAIERLGLMLKDAKLVNDVLKALPNSSEYRGDLRVVISASKRLVDRAVQLLGEENS